MKGNILNLAAPFQSSPHLGTLTAGTMQGAGEPYGERVSVVRSSWEHHGHGCCTFLSTSNGSAKGGNGRWI